MKTACVCVCVRAVDSTSEKRLITMLVENYRQNGVDGRPVVNTSTALTVTISFSLIQILQFDPTEQIITLVGWVSLVCVSLFAVICANAFYRATRIGLRMERTMPWQDVCPSYASILPKRLYISSKFFHHRIAPPF